MKTLVIHPQDPTTDFLKTIYEGMAFTVIHEEIPEEELTHEINNHDRVIFLGHGCAWGLLGWSGVAFHDDMVYALNNNPRNIFIWCNADLFVSTNELLGFHTGMFISEVKEAVIYRVDTDETKINFSNELFANSLRSVIMEREPARIYEHIRSAYTSESCSVIQFNSERLYFNHQQELYQKAAAYFVK